MQHFRTRALAQLALPFPAGSLRRIDPAQNAARFYSMDVERDLFGRVVLVRRWGRLGTFGKVRLDEHPDEERALQALMAIEAQEEAPGLSVSVGPRWPWAPMGNAKKATS